MSNTVGYSLGCVTPVRYNLTQGEDTTSNAVGYSILGCRGVFYSHGYIARCGVGYSGESVTVLNGAFTSSISQEDADQRARDYAESQLTCELIPQTPIPAPYGFLRTSDDRLFVLSPNGLYEVGRSGLNGLVLGGYGFREGVEASDGNYYFTTSNGVEKITPEGVHTTLATGLGNPNGICEGADGALYTSPTIDGGTSDGNIWRITLEGAKSVFVPTGESGCSADAVYNNLILASNNNLYTCKKANGDGQLVIVGPSGSTNVVKWGLNIQSPRILLESPDGFLYTISEQNGHLFRIHLDGSYEHIATVPVSTIFGAVLFTETPDGIFYAITTVVDNSRNSEVYRVTKSGTVDFLGQISGNSIYGIAIGFDGDPVIGGYAAADVVYRVDSTTGAITAFA